MRRFKNFVIGGIQQKIFNLVLIILALVMAAYSVVILHQVSALSRTVSETNERQKESIRAISQETMDTVVTRSLGQSTGMEAYIADDLFSDLGNSVTMLADYAERLFADPDACPPHAFALPDPSRQGEVSVQLLLEEGVDPEDPEVAKRLGLIANMSELMTAVYGTAGVNSCYVALSDGAMLLADADPAGKYGADGKLTTFPMRQRDWYLGAAETGKLFFTDVVSDVFTGRIGIMCGIPVYHDGKLEAVVGADLFLDNMAQAVSSTGNDSGFTCIINEHGHVIFSPKTDGAFSVKLAADAADLRESENADLSAFIRDAMAGSTEVRVVEADGASWYLTGARIGTVGWTIVSAVSAEAVNQPTLKMETQFDGILSEAETTFGKNLSAARVTMIVLLGLATVLAITGALILSKRIVKPLYTMTTRISELREGNLEFRMEDTYRTGDEVQELAESFADLSHKTVEYVDTVRRITAEKERIGAELSLATRIQASMLPHIFPAFPDRPEFDIYAAMDPAKEVGGDFYDYFLVDHDHLGIVMADVSGKGVPAALFMMASKIIIQSVAMLGKSPSEILARTNQAICSNNETEMFITVWMGILDLTTGKLTAANAGHEYPAVKNPDGSFGLFKDKHGFVIGGMEGVRYRDYEIEMRPGSKLFLYTDGLPEATSADDELFGTNRMVDALNIAPEKSPKEILQVVRGAVDSFVRDAEQFDDLTMLCLEYKGPMAQ